MSITAKQMIKILKKCHPEAILSVMDGDQTEQTELEFVEFCPVSKLIFLLTEKPNLTDTDVMDIEVLAQEEHFAITKYYDADNVAY